MASNNNSNAPLISLNPEKVKELLESGRTKQRPRVTGRTVFNLSFSFIMTVMALHLLNAVHNGATNLMSSTEKEETSHERNEEPTDDVL